MPTLVNQNTIDMMDLRSQPGTVIDHVFYRNTSFIVKRSGKARAVIVPLREYQEMQRRKQEAKERLFALIDEVQARTGTAQYHAGEVQQAIDEAVQAVRREKKHSR